MREGIDTPADLAGTTLATPSLGNTQDVALRAWLAEQGFETDTSGGGDVSITPQDNADTLAAFQAGALDGAWVPEPWATRLVNEGGGKVLLDEAEIWPDGQFVTTHLIVATEYLEEHPDVVRDLIAGLGEAIDEANGDAGGRPAGRQRRHREGHDEPPRRRDDRRGVGAPRVHARPDRLVAAGLGRRRQSPSACSTRSTSPIPGIYDLTLLNEVLAERGEAEVSSAVTGISLRGVHKTFGSRPARRHGAARRRPRGRGRASSSA